MEKNLFQIINENDIPFESITDISKVLNNLPKKDKDEFMKVKITDNKLKKVSEVKDNDSVTKSRLKNHSIIKNKFERPKFSFQNIRSLNGKKKHLPLKLKLFLMKKNIKEPKIENKEINSTYPKLFNKKFQIDISLPKKDEQFHLKNKFEEDKNNKNISGLKVLKKNEIFEKPENKLKRRSILKT